MPICTGLCHDKYNTKFFDPAESESTHERLPLVRDQTLAHATQLDILKLQNHATEPEYKHTEDSLKWKTIEKYVRCFVDWPPCS